MSTKLNQVIAVEKGIKSRSHKTLTEMYQTLSKKALFDGLARTYQKKDEDGEQYPPESTRVQKNASKMVEQVAELLTELFDTTFVKDAANCEARADVTLPDGTRLLPNMPATTLLFLEKQLSEIHTFVSKVPVLDPAFEWKLDTNDGLMKTEPLQTIKTKKVIKPLLLYPATDKHPAQTDKITEDVVVGHWEQVKMSGAMTETRKQELLNRVEILQKAVKFAREEANNTEVKKLSIGERVFQWLFAQVGVQAKSKAK